MEEIKENNCAIEGEIPDLQLYRLRMFTMLPYGYLEVGSLFTCMNPKSKLRCKIYHYSVRSTWTYVAKFQTECLKSEIKSGNKISCLYYFTFRDLPRVMNGAFPKTSYCYAIHFAFG